MLVETILLTSVMFDCSDAHAGDWTRRVSGLFSDKDPPGLNLGGDDLDRPADRDCPLDRSAESKDCFCHSVPGSRVSGGGAVPLSRDFPHIGNSPHPGTIRKVAAIMHHYSHGLCQDGAVSRSYIQRVSPAIENF